MVNISRAMLLLRNLCCGGAGVLEAQVQVHGGPQTPKTLNLKPNKPFEKPQSQTSLNSETSQRARPHTLT